SGPRVERYWTPAMITSAATQAATTSDRRLSRRWPLDSIPSPSPLPSGERAGVRGGALPQSLQTPRVLFELGQVILAIDGPLARHQPEIGVQHRESRVVARPGQQVERLKIIGPCPLPFTGVGAQVAQIRQRGADASLIAQDLLQLEHFLIVLLRLLPPAADRADVAQVAQGGHQRAPVAGLPVACQGLLIVVICFRVETAPEVLVAEF